MHRPHHTLSIPYSTFMYSFFLKRLAPCGRTPAFCLLDGAGGRCHASPRAFHLSPTAISLWTCQRHFSLHSSGGIREASARTAGGGGVFHRSRCHLKDVRRGDRGDSQRLTFEERAERRSGKAKESRAEREQQREELQTIVRQDFPQELEELYIRMHRQSSREALKVLNTVKCIEGVELDVPGQQNQRIPLSSVGQMIKTNAQTIELTLPTPDLVTAAMQRISRLDGTWHVSKEAAGGGGGGGGQKIKIVIPPLTTQHREKAAEKIRQYLGSLKQKAKASRTNVVKLLQRAASMVEDGIVEELTQEMNSTYETFLQEKTEELELMVEELLVSNEEDEHSEERQL